MLERYAKEFMRSAALAFSWYWLMWLGVAIAGTFVLVVSGIDWKYYELTRSPSLFSVVMFAGLAGFVIPVLAPLFLLFISFTRTRLELRTMAFTIAGSELFAYLISVFLKTFTGRFQPNLAHGLDISREFHFGFLENGIFWGWPSSHAAVAFAGSVALALLVHNKTIRIVAIIYACSIGFGASVGFHWLSDVLTGALVGTFAAYIVVSRVRAGAVIS